MHIQPPHDPVSGPRDELEQLVPDAAEEWVLSVLRREWARDDLAALLMYIRLIYRRTGMPLSSRQIMHGLGFRHGKSVATRLRVLADLGLVTWEPWQRRSIRPIDLPPV